ncbi:MAG: hypothetical protein B5766_13095 [Candidatus Lumbricidophila eiseniae]|uniref:Uncharacterized protein n=1 Tax=Candidatus Lumbricidiphila eiseniae TaxID=1969409 RepID=A0A2A6FN24_9MICO|nr:MAG: hypothetical protein B5766_13095 [Candidatus Lumbricidophila eiseniae]
MKSRQLAFHNARVLIDGDTGEECFVQVPPRHAVSDPIHANDVFEYLKDCEFIVEGLGQSSVDHIRLSVEFEERFSKPGLLALQDGQRDRVRVVRLYELVPLCFDLL